MEVESGSVGLRCVQDVVLQLRAQSALLSALCSLSDALDFLKRLHSREVVLQMRSIAGLEL